MFLLPPRSTRTDTLFPYTTLSRSRGDVLLFQHHVAALVVFVGLDDVLPRDFLAGLGVDPLIADPRVVARIEHAERDVGLALAGHQRDGDVEQPEGQRAGPDGAGHRRGPQPTTGVSAQRRPGWPSCATRPPQRATRATRHTDRH